MTNLDKEIAAIDDTLRSFNIDRPDIKEIWETGRFGTIAVPADRYKQYYDTIKSLQAELAERDRVIRVMGCNLKIAYEQYELGCEKTALLYASIAYDEYKEAAITQPTEE